MMKVTLKPFGKSVMHCHFNSEDFEGTLGRENANSKVFMGNHGEDKKEERRVERRLK
jgi:hypothetical protein